MQLNPAQVVRDGMLGEALEQWGRGGSDSVHENVVSTFDVTDSVGEWHNLWGLSSDWERNLSLVAEDRGGSGASGRSSERAGSKSGEHPEKKRG